jgi:hypothetical protein
MLHGVRDGLLGDATNHEAQVQASRQVLSS